MDFEDLEWEAANWIHLAQDSDRWLALANTVMNLRVQLKTENVLVKWAIISF
jgi:hypothetical protein